MPVLERAFDHGRRPGHDRSTPAFLELAVVVGHHVRFDLSFLQARRAVTRAGRPLGRHVRRRRPPRPRRGARLPPGHPGQPPPLGHPPPTGRWPTPRHGRAPPRAARAGRQPRRAAPRRPARARHPGPFPSRQAAAHRRPRPPPRRLPAPGAGRSGALPRQGHRPPPAERSYVSGDEAGKVGQLLGETEEIDHVVCRGALELALNHPRRGPATPPPAGRARPPPAPRRPPPLPPPRPRPGRRPTRRRRSRRRR